MATVIDAAYFFARIGTGWERPRDRFFCGKLCEWQLKWRWEQAKADRDYGRLEEIERGYRLLESL